MTLRREGLWNVARLRPRGRRARAVSCSLVERGKAGPLARSVASLVSSERVCSVAEARGGPADASTG